MKAIQSIFEVTSDADSTFGVTASTIGTAEFDFDDIIVNSQVYRRTLAAARLRKSRPKRDYADAEGDLIDFSEPSGDDPVDNATVLADLRSLSFPVKNETGADISAYNDMRERRSQPLQSNQVSANTRRRSVKMQINDIPSDDSNRLGYLNLEHEEDAPTNANDIDYPNLENHAQDHAHPPQSTNKNMNSSTSLPVVRNREIMVARAPETAIGQSRFNGHVFDVQDFDSLMADPKEWVDFWKITIDHPVHVSASRGEISRQCVLWEIFQTEMLYVRQLDVGLKIYRDHLLARWPPVLGQVRELTHIVFAQIEEIKSISTEYLLYPMKARYLEQGICVSDFANIFDEWLDRASQVYWGYCTDYSRRVSLLKTRIRNSPKLHQFMEDIRSHPDTSKLSWDTYVGAPIHQLHKYTLLLKKSSRLNQQASKASEERILLRLKKFVKVCDSRIADTARGIEDTKFVHGREGDLSKRVWIPAFADRLSERKILYRSDLYMRERHRLNILSTWLKVHVIACDDYLVLARKMGTEARLEPYKTVSGWNIETNNIR